MTKTATGDLFYANGINGTTGAYGLEPMTEAELAKIIKGEAQFAEGELNYLKSKQNEVELRRLKARLALLEVQLAAAQPVQHDALLAEIEKENQKKAELEHLGVKEGIDATNLAQAGWGIILAQQANPAIQEALSELIEWRRPQAGEFFKIFAGDNGYRPGDTYLKFLNRHGAAPGPVDPKKGVPYYLLIVGGPETIPFDFQYQLDVQFAVGRIDFGQNLDDYAGYARSVVTAEKGQVKLPRRASFFGVANPYDLSTEKSATHLVDPLYQTFKAKNLGWDIELFSREQATKAQLKQLLGGPQTPALLFTASHGMEFWPGDSRQLPHQGALLCQDWAGPEDHKGPIMQDLYFAGDDLDSQTNLLGLMTFHFACYSAGIPQYDEFAGLKKEKKMIAPQPFLAHLPTQLLSHGALATVGHVERAWGHSFFWPETGQQLAVFESTLERLLTGQPVGLAVEYFNERYAELGSLLSEELQAVSFGANPSLLPSMWTASHDARNYVVIGDPAARLPVASPGETATDRPVIEVVSLAAPIAPAASVKTGLAKPLASLSDEDWQNTPPAVQQLLSESFALIEQLKAQLATQPSQES